MITPPPRPPQRFAFTQKHERFTDFQDFESNQAVVHVDLAALLEDSGQIGVVHPDGRLVCFFLVALRRQHAHMAAPFQLHLLLHRLHEHARRTLLDQKVTILMLI